jgi:hypothetical protein
MSAPVDEHQAKRLFDDGSGCVVVHHPRKNVGKFLTEDIDWPDSEEALEKGSGTVAGEI